MSERPTAFLGAGGLPPLETLDPEMRAVLERVLASSKTQNRKPRKRSTNSTANTVSA